MGQKAYVVQYRVVPLSQAYIKAALCTATRTTSDTIGGGKASFIRKQQRSETAPRGLRIGTREADQPTNGAIEIESLELDK